MKYVILIAILIGLVSCKDIKKSEMVPIIKTTENEIIQSDENHPGKKIMETECYLCHNPKASQANMIAPPMIAVKRHYFDANATKEEFTESLFLWINDPEAPSKMPGAQEKFGKMPYLPYQEETINQIAEYMYTYEIEKPKWFDAHFEEKHGKGKGKGIGKGKGKGMGKGQGKHKNQASEETANNSADIGLGYALGTKAALGKNLINAINKEGTVAAIEFCNTEAIKLTDSMSVMNNAIIKRVSDKPRNPKNVADQEELRYIDYFKKVVASGGKVEPIIQPKNGEINFYYPITTNTMCLKCHGKPNEHVQPETLATLKKRYPNDEAVGYDVNQVRGIWAIKFDDQ